MVAEYSYTLTQTVGENANILFNNGERACRKGFITHHDGSGTFRLKGCGCKTIYRVSFHANIAASAGGTVGPISVALQEGGETVGNGVAIVTVAATGEFFNVSIDTFVILTCGCCTTVAVKNISDGTAIDVANANIIFERVA
jgi:hypothetical protein